MFSLFLFFFFFNDTATTEIYTLSLHDALPIWNSCFTDSSRTEPAVLASSILVLRFARAPSRSDLPDRKSTRLNSSHSQISYAVFCLKKKKNTYEKQQLHITRRTHCPYMLILTR